jgi:HEAT repeat protein
MRTIFIGAVAALCLLAGCGGNPSAGGKKLTDWVEVLKRSNNPAELKEAAAALAMMGPRAQPASYELVRLLSDRQWFGHYRSLNPTQVEEVFAAFSATIKAIGPGVVPVILQSLEYERPISRDVVLALSADAISDLAKGLVHVEPKVRTAVAQLLAERGRDAQGTAPLLIQALADNDDAVRRAAAKTLGYVATDKTAATTALLPALTDKTIWVRVAAIEGLQALGTTEEAAVSALTAKLQDEDPVVRGAAATAAGALGKAGGPAVPMLVSLLGDKVKDVQRKAITALGRITPLQPAAAEALVARLEVARPESDDAEIGPAAIEALAGMGAEAAPALPAMVRRMKQRGFRQSPAYAKVLSRIGPAALPVLMELVNYRVAATDAVFETNPDEGWAARATAADALAAMGAAGQEALPVLKQVAENDRNAFVVKAAKAAIKQIEAR